MQRMGRTERVIGVLVGIALVVFAGALGVTGESNVTHFTGVAVEDLLRVAPQDTVTVTDGMTLTPTGTYHPVQAVGANRGFGSITAGTAGDMLLLQNVLTYTVCVSDTGTLMLGDNRTLGQNDMVWLVCDGTNWIEASYTNN